MNNETPKHNSNKPINTAVIMLGLFLMLGLIVSGILIGGGIGKLNSGSTISVKGYAEKDIVSDFATWTCNVTIVSTTLQEGYDEIKIKTQRVLEYLEKNGLAINDIKVEMLNNFPEYEYMPNGGSRQTGYKFTQAFSTQSKDIDKITRIAEKSQELIREGIAFNSLPPQYLYTKLDDLKIAMLGEATADAKNRAEQIAKTGGNKITKIRSAQQGVFQITPRNSTEINDYGMNDTYSIEKTIKSVVTATYFLE